MITSSFHLFSDVSYIYNIYNKQTSKFVLFKDFKNITVLRYETGILKTAEIIEMIAKVIDTKFILFTFLAQTPGPNGRE